MMQNEPKYVLDYLLKIENCMRGNTYMCVCVCVCVKHDLIFVKKYKCIWAYSQANYGKIHKIILTMFAYQKEPCGVFYRKESFLLTPLCLSYAYINFPLEC